MGDIWEGEKLFLAILFVIPGFIALKAYHLLCPSEPKSSSEQVIDAIAYSCFNYALLIWPLLAMNHYKVQESSPIWFATFCAFSVLVCPIALAFGWFKLRNTDYFKASFGHPTDRAWDYFFEKRKKQCWVIVTLKDERKIGGLFSSDSFASGRGAPEEIYLEEAYRINEKGGLGRKRTNTAGILILASEVVSLEFFNIDEVRNDRGEEATNQSAGQTTAAGNEPAGEG